MVQRIPATLERLRASEVVPTFDLVEHWRKTLRAYEFSTGPGRALQALLFAHEPTEQQNVLAHGDLSPQNLVLAGDEVVLIDWEQAGCAPPGFDVGWAMAVVASTSAPSDDSEGFLNMMRRCGPERQVLQWFVRLGLLRMLWRAHTLALDQPTRTAVVWQLGRSIERELATGSGESSC